MLWTICRTFNKLPNDPLIKSLTEFQKRWIFFNIIHANTVEIDKIRGVAEKLNINKPLDMNPRQGQTKYVFDTGEEEFNKMLQKRIKKNANR